jgi:hypothetical protein
MIDLSMKREATNMKNKFKVGQKLICTHYKDHPVVTVRHIQEWTRTGRETEIWVKEDEKLWWGPVTWFKQVSK